MIVHTLNMCTDDTGPEQSLVLSWENKSMENFVIIA